MPFWNRGIFRYGPFDFVDDDPETAMFYSRETHAICSGVANNNGDICIFGCPGKSQNVTENVNNEIFAGQIWRHFDKVPKDERSSYHHHFRCTCSVDDIGNELCWWQALEAFWLNPLSCEAPAEGVRMVRNRLGRVRANKEELEEAWTNALALKPTFPFPVHMAGGSSFDRKTESESDFVAENGYPDTQFLNNALSKDDNYLTIVNDIGWLTSNSDGASHADFRHMAQMRKTQNLIQMLTFLQHDDEQPASRFLDYGCYCSPHTKIPSAQGHGLAVDDLDRQCYKNMRCRTCAKLDFGKSCHGLMGYTYHANITEDGQRELSCTDTPLSTNNADCKKSLCECDIQLVKDIVARKDIYDMNKSKTWGSFDVDAKCERDLCKKTKLGCHDADMCCGEYPRRNPLWSQEGAMACCGSKSYNNQLQTCCGLNDVRIGSSCEDLVEVTVASGTVAPETVGNPPVSTAV